MTFYWWDVKNPPECSKCFLARWVLFHKNGICSVCLGEEQADSVDGPDVYRLSHHWPLFTSQQILKLKERWGGEVHPVMEAHLQEYPVKPIRISEWVGEPGAREVSLVEYTGKDGPFETDYGESWKYKFLQNGKNKLHWFTKATNWLDEIGPGTPLQIRYTIGEHVEFRGVKETRIKRAKRETG